MIERIVVCFNTKDDVMVQLTAQQEGGNGECLLLVASAPASTGGKEGRRKLNKSTIS
jgi:hypothetical protein